MTINWDPVPYIGPIPVNWYGLGWIAAFVTALWLVRRWATASGLLRVQVENLAVASLAGALAGARLYFIAQNDAASYVREPWRILMVWEGGLAFFGGLFGNVLAAFVYARRQRLPFARAADLFAPAIPIAAAIDVFRACWLEWSTARQLYDLLGDLAIAGILVNLRGRLPHGTVFVTYLVLFSVLRFLLFFVRGDVPAVALGLKNGQWTALVILLVAMPILLVQLKKNRRAAQPA